MKGDFSRWTFDPTKYYSRLLSLQGRVLLDADFNEAMELQLQHLRQLTIDLIGPHATRDDGFKIDNVTSDNFSFSYGSYYVNGIRCDNPRAAGQVLVLNRMYLTQPYLPDPEKIKTGVPAIVYLDVWERFVTYVEDQDPAEIHQTIREVALGGPDTAARSEVIWQVRLLDGSVFRDSKLFNSFIQSPSKDEQGWNEFVELLTHARIIPSAPPSGKLKARARKPKGADLPCDIHPESRYRGPENQLYRVEVHEGGAFKSESVVKIGKAKSAADAQVSPPNFKWSRENGSIVFPIRSLDGTTVIVETLGRDDRLGLKKGDLVEVVDDNYVLQNRAEPLLKVKSLDPETFTVELSAEPAANVGTDRALHPILRRWEGFAPVSVNPDPESDGYLALEDGVEVHFSDGDYRTSDYWIIPARTATGDVEWPGTVDAPQEVPPHGIIHAYAPLAVIGASGSLPKDLRRRVIQLWN